ncbi:MAG: hypothetical protein DSY80_00075 [Desulfocapsa sp.]|nr:MAG: hypothetical protein DSY80_00075 [Desulfocapsa sp.]
MKNYLLLLLILFFITGCTGVGALTNLDGTAIVQSATDRHAIWGAVEEKKIDAVIAIADAEKEKALAEKAQAKADESNVKVVINTDASMALYQLGQANKRISEMGRLMGEALIAEKTGQSIYTAGITFTNQPEGAFAEGIRTFFHGIAEVGDSAGGKILSGGMSAKMLSDSVGRYAGDRNEYHGDANISDSMNHAESHVTGSTNVNIAQTPKIMEPSVTVVTQPEPVVVRP